MQSGLFLSANWTILPPVGGISIYEAFELSLHPIKLQIDAKVGQKIMEYVWPSRKNVEDNEKDNDSPEGLVEIYVNSPGRSSIDSPRALYSPKRVNSTGNPLSYVSASPHVLDPPLRKLGTSRSFTDLRASREISALIPPALLSPPTFLKRNNSSESLNFSSLLDAPSTPGPNVPHSSDSHNDASSKSANDAQVMKNRSTQKTFVLVKISRCVYYYLFFAYDELMAC